MQNHNKSSLSTRVQIENSKYRNPDQMERSEADNNKENRQGIGTTMTISVRLMAWNTSVLVQTESNDVFKERRPNREWYKQKPCEILNACMKACKGWHIQNRTPIWVNVIKKTKTWIKFRGLPCNQDWWKETPHNTTYCKNNKSQGQYTITRYKDKWSTLPCTVTNK